MSRTAVKSLKEYKASSDVDEKSIIEAAKRLKSKRKIPTSVALEEATVKDLKKIAVNKGVPYQVMMRVYILEGIKREKIAS